MKRCTIITVILAISIVITSCGKEYLILEEKDIKSVELLYPDDSEEYLINEESANVFVSILNEQEAIEISQEPEPAGGGAHGVIEYYNGNEVFFNVAGKLFITKYTNGESELKTYRVVDYEALNDKLCDFAKNEGVLVSDSD